MKLLPTTACLLLVGCAGIIVQPDQKTVDWPSERAPRGEVEAIDLLETIEYGLRSDGVVVWRTR
jgi:hypothetical protein